MLLEFVPMALVLIQLFSPPVASIPLGSVLEDGSAQVAIEDDDPLKDFVSSATNITRYGLRVNDIDDVYLTSALHEDEAAGSGARRIEHASSVMVHIYVDGTSSAGFFNNWDRVDRLSSYFASRFPYSPSSGEHVYQSPRIHC